MKTRTLVAALALVTGLCAAGIACADTPIYKWIDDQGRVHYSTEPHGDKSQQLAIQNQGDTPTPSPSAATDTAPGASTADPAAQAKADAALTAPKPADSVVCKDARAKASQFLQSAYIYKVDANGNRVVVSGDELKQTLDQWRAYVNKACRS